MKLTIEDLSYSVGDCVLLSRVSAAVTGCGIVGLVGPNGSGKSTLANVMSGFIRPTSGRVVFGGSVLTSLHPGQIARRGVGRLFQTQQLAWNLTALDSVRAAFEQNLHIDRSVGERGLNSRSASPDSRRRAEEILARVGLLDVMTVPARDLSFGQQRLLAFANVIAFAPKLMILDEPLAGLKENAKERVLGLLEEEKRTRIILIIDHTLSAIRSIASRLWFMDRGTLTEFTDYNQLEKSDVFRRYYLGVKDAPDAGTAAPDPQAILTLPISSQGNHRRARPLLCVRALSAGYGQTPIIRDVHLDVYSGDVVCIIGLNGSGKSTFLRAVAGTAKIFGGSIELDAVHMEDLRPDKRARKGVRLLPQDHRLFRSLTIEDNLLIGAAALEAKGWGLAGLPWATTGQLRAVVADLLGRLRAAGLSPQRRAAGTFSGGEQSRVAFMQMDLGQPALVLLDEPTSGIDGVAAAALMRQVHTWRMKEVPVVIIEHDLNFVFSVATRVAVVQLGSLREIPDFRRQGMPSLLNDLLGTSQS